ncbi:MAG: DUF6062 family protein [Oscillospiraceae bacterium]
MFENRAAKQKKAAKLNCDCFVCSKIQWGMDRLLVTVFELFENSSDFRRLFSEQKYLCLPHYELLTTLCAESASKKTQPVFAKACEELVKKYLDELTKDVSHYCKMYDYRNAGANADWGNSKDSIERAIKFLTSR